MAKTMDEAMSTISRAPTEDRDTWLTRVEASLDYNHEHRPNNCPVAEHDPELKILGADRHTYVMWWDFYAVTEALVRRRALKEISPSSLEKRCSIEQRGVKKTERGRLGTACADLACWIRN